MKEAEFVGRLRRVLETSRDSELHDAIWSYREGTLDRAGLLSHPAYQRHMTESWEHLLAEVERQGGSLAAVWAEVRRLALEHGHDEAVADADD